MTRVSDIADYLLSTGIGDTDAAWKAETCTSQDNTVSLPARETCHAQSK